MEQPSWENLFFPHPIVPAKDFRLHQAVPHAELRFNNNEPFFAFLPRQAIVGFIANVWYLTTFTTLIQQKA